MSKKINKKLLIEAFDAFQKVANNEIEAFTSETAFIYGYYMKSIEDKCPICTGKLDTEGYCKSCGDLLFHELLDNLEKTRK